MYTSATAPRAGRLALLVLSGCLCIALEAAPASPAEPAKSSATARALLRQIAAELPETIEQSRLVLLGQRQTTGPSCVRPLAPSDLGTSIPRPIVDPKGGPGTRFLSFARAARIRSAREQFAWQQKGLRRALRHLQDLNRVAAPRVTALSAKARQLVVALGSCKVCPAGGTIGAVGDGRYGSHLRGMDQAARAGDLAASRREAAELAGALFALEDLHRWVEFLLVNAEQALDFQARCRVMFAWVDAADTPGNRAYASLNHESCFPGSSMIVPMADNLLEVERQAEGLFRRPARVPASRSATVGAEVWMPCELRETFRALRGCLPARDRAAWDRAAAQPFERSYLVSMLHRIRQAKTVNAVGQVLRRYGATPRRPGVSDLMDVLFYRGGEVAGGIVWGDRFEPRLVQAAGGIAGTGEQVLRRAHTLTHTLLDGWANYENHIWTLGEALDRRRLDCIRGTDMIGSLYRNAGRGRFYCIRLLCGFTGHSVGGAEVPGKGKQMIRIADSLADRGPAGCWPSAYFQGFLWPTGYPQNTAPVFAAEMSARGLDNYIFAEGYVVRGPHAGTLLRAAVPYLPDRARATVARAYRGPYPGLPGIGRPVADTHVSAR